MAMDMPTWCGACDERTRRFNLGDLERRCPDCHPYWAFGHHSIDPSRAPAGRAEQEQATRWLVYELVSLRTLPMTELRRRTSAFFDCGWTPQDIVHALDFDPDGSAFRSVPSTSDPPELTRRAVLNMLSSWCDEGGKPLASPTQLAAARRRKTRSRQQATRSVLAEIDARQVNPDGAVVSGAREVARKAAARAKQLKLEGRQRESSALCAALAEQQAQESKVQQALRRLDKAKFGVVASSGPAEQTQAGHLGTPRSNQAAA
ncbi:hypothetical protein Rhe02_00290 [Rhizocola hellebori]|uniref:Uncharacterized protein n=1 Tax=Rhizocola hellebori TaxID=1392758 RepID=A0A8J3VCV5_9ACTN|nr:hypothetical protein [Rhizocola hellebori]GIH01962.1 hypothetical protein Rhe02_00290 [Rhizocola hellebori]